jgi:hypothetical protein
VLRAVGKYTQCPWILLYLKRWLEAPAHWRMAHWYRARRGPRRAEW